MDRGRIPPKLQRRPRRHFAHDRPADCEWGFSDVHAYLLCSVAMHLRLSQVVNEPMFTVSAALPKTLPPRKSSEQRTVGLRVELTFPLRQFSR